uniref:Uncharacterized protein n=1 Tax=Oryza brachyantha TaxID=4533 RepID=J3KWK8_ORYBR
MARARPYNKREWELGEEERWRKLARTVPAVLMPIGTSRKAIRSTMKVKSAIKAVRRTRSLSVSGEPSDYDLLDGAHGKIERISATHAKAGHLFVRCAAHLSGLQGGAAWQAWENHRADADRFANEARQCLSRVESAIEAAGDVLLAVQWRRGRRLPQEARDLLHRAKDDVSKALDALRDMHRAIVLEFFDAWMVLNRDR